MNKLLGDYDKPLFWANLVACISICVLAIVYTDAFGAFWGMLQNFFSLNFGWFYALTIAMGLFFSFYLALSKFGSLRLGRDDEKPEYSLFAWTAMLFSAGIGVGVYFWGVAEPMYHFMQTPYMAEAGSPEAVSQAMAITYLHWGMHGWGVYVLAGLGISIAAYRLNKPLNFSSSLYGLFGDKVGGTWGRVLDFFCAFCTVAGLSTSIGMGVLSLAYVVNKIFGIPNTTMLQVGMMAVIFVLYTFSTTAGIEKGMARVSTINVYLCFGVCAFIFLFGNPRFVLNLFVESMGVYINYMPQMTLWQDTVNQTGWLGWWTTFYWAWWLAWVPFVGGFLARISRGRTVREFLLGGLLLPSLILLVWFTVMGGNGIDLQMKGVMDLWTPIQASTESGYYLMLDQFPLTTLISIIALVNLLTFLVTSADAGSIYVGVLCSKGISNPTVGMKFINAIIIATLPVALIFGGGLKALQTMSIVAAFPFAITTVLTIFSVLKMVKMDYVNHTQL